MGNTNPTCVACNETTVAGVESGEDLYVRLSVETKKAGRYWTSRRNLGDKVWLVAEASDFLALFDRRGRWFGSRGCACDAADLNELRTGLLF